MSKKNKNVDAEIDVSDPMVAGKEDGAVDTTKTAEFKAKKAEALQRYKEKKAQAAIDRKANAEKLLGMLKDDGVFEKLPEDMQTFVTGLAAGNTSSGSNGRGPLFTALFGADAAVGTTITLAEAFNKTFKGKATLDYYVRRWAKKGIIVTFTADNANMLNSTYKIEQM